MKLLKEYLERNDIERHIIDKAYQFEVDAIENESYAFNPYLKRVTVHKEIK